jgi:hypothetical protein
VPRSGGVPGAAILPVQQVGAGEVDAHPGPAQAGDRLAVEALGGRTLAQQRARTRVEPERPVGATGRSPLGEPPVGTGRRLVGSAARGGLDQLDQRPVQEGQLPGVLGGSLGGDQCLVVAAKAVAEHSVRPLDDGYPNSFASQ